MSTTKMAISAREPPLCLRLVNAACPGVSMKRNPGILSYMFALSIKGHVFFIWSIGYFVNEIF